MADRAGCQPGASGGGTGTCQEFLEGCWCPKALPPLGCDADGNPLLRLSSDAGNGASIGTDGGLYTTTQGTPPPDTGRKTVAGLPASGVFGGESCGGLLYAFGSPYGCEHLIANEIQIIDNYSIATTDGVAVWSPYNNNQGFSVYTTSPSTAPLSSLTSVDAIGSFVDAGNPYQPVSDRSNAPAADKPTGRDVNWWGWCTGTWLLKGTAEQLGDINARAVSVLRAWTAADVPATIRAVAQARAAASVIITVNPADVTTVAQITAAGIAAGVHVDADTTITPATVTSSGATWVGISWRQTDARISAFVAAGLNVLVYTDSTHYQTNRALNTLAARGVIAHDPVYARGQTGDLRYRSNAPDWTTKTARYGMLTRNTQDGSIVNGRGFTVNGQDGVVTEPLFGYRAGVRSAFTQMNFGELNPIPNATSWTFDWFMGIRGTQSINSFGKGGIIFGLADDRDFTVDTGAPIPTFANGYIAFVRLSSGANEGQLVIAKITNGAYSQLVASTSASAWGPNSWGRVRITVSATTLRFARLNSTGAESYSTSINDASFRGPYVKWYKEEGNLAGEAFQLAYRPGVYAPV